MNWVESIKLNAVISKCDEDYDLTFQEEPCPPEVIEAIANEIEKSSILKSNFCGVKIRQCKTIASLNRQLVKVFDIADRYKVWCGL